jgi:hypothetical protein
MIFVVLTFGGAKATLKCLLWQHLLLVASTSSRFLCVLARQKKVWEDKKQWPGNIMVYSSMCKTMFVWWSLSISDRRVQSINQSCTDRTYT